MIRHCKHAGCDRWIDWTDDDGPTPDGWTHIWTSGLNPRVGHFAEGFYCDPHAEIIERHIDQAAVATARRPRSPRR
jgi:hypothetical protein